MKTLYDYISDKSNIQEGLIKSAITLRLLKTLDPKHLLDGILSMYDYIVDQDDIKKFFQDYPLKEQPLWRNLYEMYSKKLFSIIDAGSNEEEMINECFPAVGELIKVTPEFRRNLRKFINGSKNSGLDIKPSDPEMIMAMKDEVNNSTLIFTVNKASGMIRSLFSAADRKWLEMLLEKIAGA